MAKLLRPQDKILLGLAVMGDIFEEMRDPLGIMATSYKTLYGFVPRRYRRSNYSTRLSKALKTGYIEKIIKDGDPYFRLTSQGVKKLTRDFPLLFFQKKRWDGKWRVVVFDIPEKERRLRSYLRQKLIELGFGMMQESVWISPLGVTEDLREYLENHNLADFVFVLVAQRLFVGDEKKLAAKVWPLKKINQEYEKILEKWEKEKEAKREKRADFIKELKNLYLEVLAIDPCLPRELLPNDWQGEKVRSLIKHLI